MWGIVPTNLDRQLMLPFSGDSAKPDFFGECATRCLVAAGADKICLVAASEHPRGATGFSGYFRHPLHGVDLCVLTRPPGLGLCDAVFRALPLIGDGEHALVGVSGLLQDEGDDGGRDAHGLRALGTAWHGHGGALSLLLFSVARPDLFESVLTDDFGNVVCIEVQKPGATSPWVWGALKATGAGLRALEAIWREGGGAIASLGALMNIYIARGGAVNAARAGEKLTGAATARERETRRAGTARRISAIDKS